MSHEPRLVEVRKNILKQNDLVARELRQRFRDAGVFVVSLVSSPGAGKTALLERTLTLLHPRYRVAALVGDLATENDAARLARSGAPVRQITTGTVCHLEAAMVQTRARGLGAGRARLPLRRERRQPGLPRLLRPGREPAARAALGHRGRGQAAQVPHHLQHRRRRAHHQDRPGRGGGVRLGRGAAATSSPCARACGRSGSRRRTGAGMDRYLALLEAGLLAARGAAVTGAP